MTLAYAKSTDLEDIFRVLDLSGQEEVSCPWKQVKDALEELGELWGYGKNLAENIVFDIGQVLFKDQDPAADHQVSWKTFSSTLAEIRSQRESQAHQLAFRRFCARGTYENDWDPLEWLENIARESADLLPVTQKQDENEESEENEIVVVPPLQGVKLPGSIFWNELKVEGDRIGYPGSLANDFAVSLGLSSQYSNQNDLIWDEVYQLLKKFTENHQGKIFFEIYINGISYISLIF